MAGQMTMPGATDLIGTASSLGQQVAGESEEQRKKRLQAIQSSKQLPVGMSSLAPDYGAALSTS